MRKTTRTSTMIALRARRQALEIARDIAYPHVEVSPKGPPVPFAETAPTTTRREALWYELWPRKYQLELEPGPAPWWIWWLVAGCLASIATAAWIIFSSV